MTNLEALTMVNCRAHEGLDGWYFPCGLGIRFNFAKLEALFHPTTGENHLAAFEAPMVELAHRRHHEEQHDEMDQWALVEVVDPEGHLHEMWCECVQQDTHWHFIPLFRKCPYLAGGTEYS